MSFRKARSCREELVRPRHPGNLVKRIELGVIDCVLVLDDHDLSDGTLSRCTGSAFGIPQHSPATPFVSSDSEHTGAPRPPRKGARLQTGALAGKPGHGTPRGLLLVPGRTTRATWFPPGNQ